jgi:cytochrome c
MASLRMSLIVGLACATAVGLTGCSKQKESAAADTTAPDTAATATTNTAAPGNEATVASAQPAPAAATPAPPSATMIKLDIKDASGNQVSGDPTSGKEVFQQCMTCHSKEPGVNKVGPSLHGIIGRHSGMIPGFNYSTANKNSGKIWSEQELYTYLADPQKDVPGTYMTFTGVKDPQKRADVIAYLQENTK